MPSKADLDNHSNQLNPNNDEYGNSRGWGRDDDSDAISSTSRSSRSFAEVHRQLDECSLGVRVAIVGLTGRARYIAFRTSHTVGLKWAHYLESARARNEDFAALVMDEIARQLELLWKERLATYILYSEDGQRIVLNSYYEFPAALHRTSNPDLQLWNEHGKKAVALAHAMLAVPSNVQVPGVEDWGMIYDNPSARWTPLSRGLHQHVTQLLAEHPDMGEL